jgi:hypothetical protein
MRHLGSILLSVVLAPVIYLLTGVGLVKVFTALRQFDTRLTVSTLIGAAALLGAGILYALLVHARLSPVGPALAGLAFLFVGGWAMTSISAQQKMPLSVLGVQGAGQQAMFGYTLLLAVPLLATVLSPRRWRRYAQPRPAQVAAPGYPGPGGYAPPPGLGYPAPPPFGAPAFPTSAAPTSAAPASPAPTSGASGSYAPAPPAPAQAAFGQPAYGQPPSHLPAPAGQAPTFGAPPAAGPAPTFQTPPSFETPPSVSAPPSFGEPSRFSQPTAGYPPPPVWPSPDPLAEPAPPRGPEIPPEGPTQHMTEPASDPDSTTRL